MTRCKKGARLISVNVITAFQFEFGCILIKYAKITITIVVCKFKYMELYKSQTRDHMINYQLLLILTDLLQTDLKNVGFLMTCVFYQAMMTLHLLNGVANNVESTRKSIITSISLF